MQTLNHIAFFWIGPDVTIPTLLVRSIRAAFGPHFNVHQLSDRETPIIEGVTTHKKLKLSPHIMVARLEAYAALSISEPTLFLDADMLVLRPFDLPPLPRMQSASPCAANATPSVFQNASGLSSLNLPRKIPHK